MKKTILTHVIALSLLSLNTFADSGEGRSGPDRSGVSIPVSADRSLSLKEFNKTSVRCSLDSLTSFLRQLGVTDESFLQNIETNWHRSTWDKEQSDSVYTSYFVSRSNSQSSTLVVSKSNPNHPLELLIHVSAISDPATIFQQQSNLQTAKGEFTFRVRPASPQLPHTTRFEPEPAVLTVSDELYSTLKNATINNSTDIFSDISFTFKTAQLRVSEELIEDPFGITTGTGLIVSSISYEASSPILAAVNVMLGRSSNYKPAKLIYNSEPYIQCMNNKIGN